MYGRVLAGSLIAELLRYPNTVSLYLVVLIYWMYFKIYGFIRGRRVYLLGDFVSESHF